MAESIDFKLPLATACAVELSPSGACANARHGGGAAQRCLQDAVARGAATPECAAEVAADARRSGGDYRLHARLRAACDADVRSLCDAACPGAAEGACGGRVLACLTEKQEQLTSKAKAVGGRVGRAGGGRGGPKRTPTHQSTPPRLATHSTPSPPTLFPGVQGRGLLLCAHGGVRLPQRCAAGRGVPGRRGGPVPAGGPG